MQQSYFTPKTFKFLRDLAANNNRTWFKAHQHEYENTVREPALDFITDIGDRLEEISSHFVADSRKVGGSRFRIQRDTRFSKDKIPYKENTGVQFRHEMAADAHAPGFYLHLQPGGCFMGAGLWRPATKVAYEIRDRIDADQSGWLKATAGKKFASVFTLGGDTLVRPPKGFDPEHPLLVDLKRKDFIASTNLTQKQVTSPDFDDDFIEMCRTAAPFMKFLCDAVGVRF